MPSERTRLYELMLVVTPEADDEGVAAAVQRTADLIGARGGMITEQERWGLRRLAYPINGYVEGHYVLMRFAWGAAHARELERTLIAAEDVLRHLVTTVEREVDLETLRAEAAAAQAEAEAPEQAEPVSPEQDETTPTAQAEPEAPEQTEPVPPEQDETTPTAQAEPESPQQDDKEPEPATTRPTA